MPIKLKNLRSGNALGRWSDADTRSKDWEFPNEYSKSGAIAVPAYSQAAVNTLPLGWSKVLL